MDVHHVLQHHVIVVDLDPLGDPGDGEELLVFVELYAGHDGAVVEHVRGVGQGRQRPHAVVPDNKSSLLILADVVKLRQGSGKDRQGMALKGKGLKA